MYACVYLNTIISEQVDLIYPYCVCYMHVCTRGRALNILNYVYLPHSRSRIYDATKVLNLGSYRRGVQNSG